MPTSTEKRAARKLKQEERKRELEVKLEERRKEVGAPFICYSTSSNYQNINQLCIYMHLTE